MEHNLTENMKETAKSLCQLWDQNHQLSMIILLYSYSNLYSKSYLQKKKKHVVVKELSFLPYTFSNFILHPSIQCLFGREFDAIFTVLSKVRIWLSFFLYILKIMKNRQFVRRENTLFFKFRFFQFILRRKHSD